MHAWFLEINFVQKLVCVFICVHPRLLKTNHMKLSQNDQSNKSYDTCHQYWYGCGLSIMKHAMNYCQRRLMVMLLAVHFTVRGILPVSYTILKRQSTSVIRVGMWCG